MAGSGLNKTSSEQITRKLNNDITQFLIILGTRGLGVDFGMKSGR